MPVIVIADDKEENRFVLRNFFKLFGANSDISIFEASNSTEVVELVIAKKPDIVFMDIKMETGDAGLIALRKIRENPIVSQTQVWAMTAKILEEAIPENIEGFNDYIVKPYDLKELIVKVAKHLQIGIPENIKLKMGL